MKAGTKLVLIVALVVIGLALMIWGNVIMFRFEGYREIMKAARHTAQPQFISGIVLLLIAYFLTYSKKL